MSLDTILAVIAVTMMLWTVVTVVGLDRKRPGKT